MSDIDYAHIRDAKCRVMGMLSIYIPYGHREQIGYNIETEMQRVAYHEIARLTAERDRLREALMEIAEGCKEPIQRTCDDCLYDNYAYCNEYSKIIARKALEEE